MCVLAILPMLGSAHGFGAWIGHLKQLNQTLELSIETFEITLAAND
jgi:hypothetical protein